MYYNDHDPAHFHARYGDRVTRVAVENGQILSGTFPRSLGGRVKSGHLWTPQNRPFPAPRDWSLRIYFTASSVGKVVRTLVRQLRGPHLSTCA